MNIVEELMAEAHERDGEYKEALSIYERLDSESSSCYQKDIWRLKNKVNDGYRVKVR